MDEDQEQAGPADTTHARELTEQLRTAIEDVRTAVLVLARRVRAAHRARVWTVLGHRSWPAYAFAEFGIGRSTAYRLLDLAAVAEAIETTVQHELGVSHAWDTTDLVLPVRAIADLKGRTAELTDLIAERLTEAHQDAGSAAIPAETVGGIVAAAVAEVRARPDVPAVELETGPAPDGTTAEAWRRHVHAGRDAITQQRAAQLGIGTLALELAPAHLSDRQAEDAGLTRLANDIGITTDEILACRRYAITSDVRAMNGW
ncbi:hypothetical protein [Kitasatospora griseola]|uniref:hypothetical protein n=1 Tax=Kitasatospora griseola TaxID=2064 RepID=UPI00167130D3|nr:hypothetical protein [Kitasatospora griseola]GGR00758.1 hypothetical protein GCM10010195_65710 [Kitasatospora griseola]